MATSSLLLLWDVLTNAYSRLAFDITNDEAFKAMLLARIIEPTSKVDTVRVLGAVGAPCPSLRIRFRALQRCLELDYREMLARVPV